MGRRSTLDALPQDIRDTFNQLVRAGRTIEEIRAHLAELGHETSRSAVGRASKNVKAILATHAIAREAAEALTTKLGEAPRGDTSTLLAEMIKSLAYNVIDGMSSAEQDEFKAGSMDVMLLAKSLDHLSKAGAITHKLRKELRADALAEAAKQVETTGRKLGLSDATRDALIKELKLL